MNEHVGRWDSAQLLPPNEATSHLSHVCDFCPKRCWCESSATRSILQCKSLLIDWSIGAFLRTWLYGCCTHACSSSKRCTHALLDHKPLVQVAGDLEVVLVFAGIMWSRCTSVGFFNMIDSAARLYRHSLLWRMQGQLEVSAQIYLHACMDRSMPLVSSSTTTLSSVS